MKRKTKRKRKQKLKKESSEEIFGLLDWWMMYHCVWIETCWHTEKMLESIVYGVCVCVCFFVWKIKSFVIVVNWNILFLFHFKKPTTSIVLGWCCLELLLRTMKNPAFAFNGRSTIQQNRLKSALHIRIDTSGLNQSVANFYYTYLPHKNTYGPCLIFPPCTHGQP